MPSRGRYGLREGFNITSGGGASKPGAHDEIDEHEHEGKVPRHKGEAPERHRPVGIFATPDVHQGEHHGDGKEWLRLPDFTGDLMCTNTSRQQHRHTRITIEQNDSIMKNSAIPLFP